MKYINWILTLVLVSLVPGCDFPQPPRIVTITNPPALRPFQPSDLKTLQEAMAAIMTACREDLYFHAPDPVHIHLYKNSASFASFGQGWRTLPIDMDSIRAFNRNDTIHVDLGKTKGQNWSQLIDLLAHEYGHAIESNINNGRHGYRWFSEGFATWTAAKVLHSLGWRDYAHSLERAQIELINNYDNLHPLSNLEWDWQLLSEKPKGYIATYVLGFYATARLIDQLGISATIEFMKSRDFNKSFHMTYETFTAEFAAHLSNIEPAKKADPTVIHKPDWKVGNRWTYAVKYPGEEPIATREIVREDKFEGNAAYVFKTGNREIFRSKKTLERLAEIKDGQLTRKRSGSSRDFSWPLTLGKRWRNSDLWEDSQAKEKYRTRYDMVVSEIGNITVPAGTFLAARIQAFDSSNGHLMWESWYSPITKWIVKTRDFSSTAFRDAELVSFKID